MDTMRLRLYLTFYRTTLPFSVAIGLIGLLQGPATALVLFGTAGSVFTVLLFQYTRARELYFYYNRSIGMLQLATAVFLLNGAVALLLTLILSLWN